MSSGNPINKTNRGNEAISASKFISSFFSYMYIAAIREYPSIPKRFAIIDGCTFLSPCIYYMIKLAITEIGGMAL